MLRVLLSLTGSRGTTLVVVTHDAALARSADRVLELREGKLVSRESVGQKSAEELRSRRAARGVS